MHANLKAINKTILVHVNSTCTRTKYHIMSKPGKIYIVAILKSSRSAIPIPLLIIFLRCVHACRKSVNCIWNLPNQTFIRTSL